jgi:hypothetical protein
MKSLLVKESFEMGQKQTTTKVISIIFDVTKSDAAKAEEQWQAYLRNEISLETVLKSWKKWQVETRLIPDPNK